MKIKLKRNQIKFVKEGYIDFIHDKKLNWYEMWWWEKYKCKSKTGK